jgi:GntR family transcriptional regulator
VSTLAPLRVLTDDPTPPYEQLRRQLVDLIHAGALAEGERLPPVRQLAADLGLAAGTVARTYRELEAAGLVSTRRGGGTRVQNARRRSAPELREDLDRHAQDMVRRARLLGAADADVRRAVERALGAGA